MSPKCEDSIWVVGGGFTGVVTALHLAEAGYAVCLFEKSPALGGVMLDDMVASSPRMRGCHVLQVNPFQDILKRWGLDALFVEVPNDVTSVTWHQDVVYRAIGCEGPLITSEQMPSKASSSLILS